MITFGRYDETETLPKPLFGGTKGESFVKVIENIENKFSEYLNDIKNCRHVILDVLVPAWHEQILR